MISSAAEKGGEGNNLLPVNVCGVRAGVRTNFIFIGVQGERRAIWKTRL